MGKQTVTTSRYHSHDGWALVGPNDHVLYWSFAGTRAEVRHRLKGRQLDMLAKYRIRKVRMVLQPIGGW